MTIGDWIVASLNRLMLSGWMDWLNWKMIEWCCWLVLLKLKQALTISFFCVCVVCGFTCHRFNKSPLLHSNDNWLNSTSIFATLLIHGCYSCWFNTIIVQSVNQSIHAEPFNFNQYWKWWSFKSSPLDFIWSHWFTLTWLAKSHFWQIHLRHLIIFNEHQHEIQPQLMSLFDWFERTIQ